MFSRIEAAREAPAKPEQKCTPLKIDEKLVKKFGPVSAEVAEAMARAALGCSQADIAVSVVEIANRAPPLFAINRNGAMAKIA